MCLYTYIFAYVHTHIYVYIHIYIYTKDQHTLTFPLSQTVPPSSPVAGGVPNNNSPIWATAVSVGKCGKSADKYAVLRSVYVLSGDAPDWLPQPQSHEKGQENK